MSGRSLRKLSGSKIRSNLQELVRVEHHSTFDVVLHLLEVETRKLYLPDYSSTWKFALAELGYSNGEAKTRLGTMRLLLGLPELEEKIKDGDLCFTAAAQVQTFFEVQPEMSTTEKLEFVQRIEGMTTREIGQEIVKIAPRPVPNEKIIPLSETHMEVRVVLEPSVVQQLEEIKAWLSSKNPYAKLSDAITYAAGVVAEMENRRRSVTSAIKRKSRGNKVSRHIPAAIRRAVLKRDGGCCTMIDRKTGERCNSTHQLQYEHIIPWAHGGTHELSNLRLLCREHNEYMREMTFGPRNK